MRDSKFFIFPYFILLSLSLFFLCISILQLYLLKVLADQQQVILKGLLEESIDNKDNEATIKAKTFYKSCMDLRKYYTLCLYYLMDIHF